MVFFVNEKNPVESLTLEEIESIYAKHGMEFRDIVWLDKEKDKLEKIQYNPEIYKIFSDSKILFSKRKMIHYFQLLVFLQCYKVSLLFVLLLLYYLCQKYLYLFLS